MLRSRRFHRPCCVAKMHRIREDRALECAPGAAAAGGFRTRAVYPGWYPVRMTTTRYRTVSPITGQRSQPIEGIAGCADFIIVTGN